MQINTNTWHYKNWEFWNMHSHSRRAWRSSDMRKANLCLYFWVVVLRHWWPRFTTLANRNPAVTSLILFLTISNVFGVVLHALNPTYAWWMGMVYCGGFLLAFAACLFVVWGIVQVEEWLKNRKLQDKSAKQPSFVTEWVKAKHERVCPIIEFTSEDV